RDSGPRGALDRLGAVRVRRDLPAPHCRLGDNGVQLFLRVLRRAGRFLFAQHASAGEDLDQIGAPFDVVSHLLADRVDAARDSGEPVEAQVWREAVQVPVTTSGAEGEGRHRHAGPGDGTVVYRVAHGD